MIEVMTVTPVTCSLKQSGSNLFVGIIHAISAWLLAFFWECAARGDGLNPANVWGVGIT